MVAFICTRHLRSCIWDFGYCISIALGPLMGHTGGVDQMGTDDIELCLENIMYFELCHLSQMTPLYIKEIHVVWFISSNFCFTSIDSLVYPLHQAVISGVRHQYSGSEPYRGTISGRFVDVMLSCTSIC